MSHCPFSYKFHLDVVHLEHTDNVQPYTVFHLFLSHYHNLSNFKKKKKKSNDYLKEQFDRHPYYFYLSGFLPEYYFTLYLYLRGKV